MDISVYSADVCLQIVLQPNAAPLSIPLCVHWELISIQNWTINVSYQKSNCSLTKSMRDWKKILCKQHLYHPDSAHVTLIGRCQTHPPSTEPNKPPTAFPLDHVTVKQKPHSGTGQMSHYWPFPSKNTEVGVVSSCETRCHVPGN